MDGNSKCYASGMPLCRFSALLGLAGLRPAWQALPHKQQADAANAAFNIATL